MIHDDLKIDKTAKIKKLLGVHLLFDSPLKIIFSRMLSPYIFISLHFLSATMVKVKYSTLQGNENFMQCS